MLSKALDAVGGLKHYIKPGDIVLLKPNKDLAYLTALFESGKMAPVIDKCFPLSETGEAFRYFDEGHPSGQVVITVEHDARM